MIDKQFVRASADTVPDGHDVPLPDIYVDLDVVRPSEERARDSRAWAMRLMRGEGKDRTPLLEALGKPATPRGCWPWLPNHTDTRPWTARLNGRDYKLSWLH